MPIGQRFVSMARRCWGGRQRKWIRCWPTMVRGGGGGIAYPMMLAQPRRRLMGPREAVLPRTSGRSEDPEAQRGRSPQLARAGPPTPTTGSAGLPRQIAPLRDDSRLQSEMPPHAVFSRPPPAPHLPGSPLPPRDRKGPTGPRARCEPLTHYEPTVPITSDGTSKRRQFHPHRRRLPPARAAPVPAQNRAISRPLLPPPPGESQFSPGARHPPEQPTRPAPQHPDSADTTAHLSSQPPNGPKRQRQGPERHEPNLRPRKDPFEQINDLLQPIKDLLSRIKNPLKLQKALPKRYEVSSKEIEVPLKRYEDLLKPLKAPLRPHEVTLQPRKPILQRHTPTLEPHEAAFQPHKPTLLRHDLPL